MEGMPAQHPFDGLMGDAHLFSLEGELGTVLDTMGETPWELSKDTAKDQSIDNFPWPDLHLECPDLFDSEITLLDTEPPETSSSLKNQIEGGNIFLSNDGGKSGEDNGVTYDEDASVIFDENKNADYHNFCTDIGGNLNDDDDLIASVMLDGLESNTGNSGLRDPGNVNDTVADHSTFDEHLISAIADDPPCGQVLSTAPVVRSSPDPAPAANMLLHFSASSSSPPMPDTMTPLPSPTSPTTPTCHTDSTEADTPMPPPSPPPPPPTPHSSVTLDEVFALEDARSTSPILPPHSQPSASGKQDASGAARNTPPSPFRISTLPAATLPNMAISATVEPSAPTTLPNSPQFHDQLLLEVEYPNITDYGPASTDAPVSSKGPALASIFLQHEVPQSLFKGYLLARFPLNLAHKLEMKRLGRVQKRTIKIATTQSDCPLNRNNEEAMEASKYKLSSSKLPSGGAQHSLDVVIEPKQSESSEPHVVASVAGQFLRIPSRRERMARQRAPIPQNPMKIKCPMCKLTYKHMGTLKRHLITKHEYFDDIDILP